MNCASETSIWECVEEQLRQYDTEGIRSDNALYENSHLLIDLEQRGTDGLNALKHVRDVCPGLPVIVLIGRSTSSDLEAEILRLDCTIVGKPICSGALRHAMGRVVNPESERDRLVDSQPVAAGASQDESSFQGTWLERIQPLFARVASSNVPVLLRGETGVGKEVIARQLHSHSQRRDAPFVKVNCAALPSELVESELFGYDKGAFTGAFKNTPGKFEMANGGTILLDEIGDMDLKLQAKLLQVLQDQEFYRLGATERSRVDVRVMAASHCDFEEAITEKRFREDLYYRLNIVDFKIPPLRERRDEILPLCEALLDRHATPDHPKLEITAILRQVLLEYNWPGNVRELENVIRKYLVLRNPSLLAAEIRQRTVRSKSVFVPAPGLAQEANSFPDTAEELILTKQGLRTPVSRRSEGIPGWLDTSNESSGPKLVSKPLNTSKRESESALWRIDEVRKAGEIDAILNALEASLWNRKQAARLLRLDYKALLYKMRKLGIGEKRTGSLG